MDRSKNINSLPSELLCELFSLTISPKSARSDRCRLILVCRLWEEYVEASAFLWTDISAGDGRAYMHRALERSKACMINLHYPSHTEAYMDLESFWAEAGPHIARWRSLMIDVRRLPQTWESMLGPLTTAQAPILESLELHMPMRGQVSRNVVVLFNGAPAPSTLKYLVLYRVQVAVEPLSLSGLIRLHVCNVSNLSTPQLLEILHNSPLLETLTLDDNRGLLGVGTQFSAVSSILLSKLSTLTLEWIDYGAANSILSAIRFPNRRFLYICDDLREGAWAVLLTPTIAHILHTTIPDPDPKFSDIEVNIESREGGDECVVQVRGILLQLFVDGENQIEGILGWLAEGLGSEAAACPVRLSLKCADMDPMRLVSVPSPLVIKQLSIHEGLLTSLLQSPFVAMFQPPKAMSSGGLLGQVENLTVEFHTIESQKEFIIMLRRRYAEVEPYTETEARRLTSLKSVELRGRPRADELVEEILGIFRGVNVFWGDQ